MVQGQQRACMPVYIGKSGDLVRCYRCLTDRQTTEYRATQLVYSIKLKLSHVISKWPHTNFHWISPAGLWGWGYSWSVDETAQGDDRLFPRVIISLFSCCLGLFVEIWMSRTTCLICELFSSMHLTSILLLIFALSVNKQYDSFKVAESQAADR